MTSRSTLLASGPGWLVRDIVCTAGPHDRPFEEQHERACIAAVTAGTFQYRSSKGDGLLAPGAVLLGNPGSCFRCEHEHGVGDRCLSFHFGPEYLESVVAAVPGASRTTFGLPRLPPLARLMPVLAAAEAARDAADPEGLEEIGLRLAGAVATVLAQGSDLPPQPNRRDERRITDALRRMERNAHMPLALADLARGAGMSTYHFLRTFRRVVGMTPHQFTLHTRLHRAAVRLRSSGDAVASIAFDEGFGDLSTFNRRFRRIFGLSPRAYRAGLRRRAHA